MDNTVGSLTQFQRAVVIGSILGDGYIRKLEGRKDAFLEINHSINQKPYVDWKYTTLRNLVRGEPKARTTNGRRIAYRFYTMQHPVFTELQVKFYSNGRKYIPQSLMLDPVTLAIWYMDDGSACRSSDVYFNTQQFDEISQRTLLKALAKMGIEARLNKDKSYWRIRLIKNSIPHLRTIISPYVIPSMKYKLGYDPVETTRRSPPTSQKVVAGEDIVRSSR